VANIIKLFGRNLRH